MSRRTAVFAVLCCLVPLLTGCALIFPKRIPAVPSQHIVLVDASGRIADPTGNSRCHPGTLLADDEKWEQSAEGRGKVLPPSTPGQWNPCNGKFGGVWLRNLNYRLDANDPQSSSAAEAYLDDLFNSMDEYYRLHSAGNGRQERKLLIIIHGGLNTNESTIQRAQDLSQRMLDDGYYPIFINWQSSLPRSWADHMGAVRQGDNVGYLRGAIGTLPYLLADLGRGVTRAPIIWYESVKNDADRVRRAIGTKLRPGRMDFIRSPEEQIAQQQYQQILNEPLQCGKAPMDVEMQASGYNVLQDGRRSTLTYLAFGLTPFRVIWRQPGFRVVMRLLHFSPQLHLLTYLPTKYLAAPLLDGLGTPAWDEMKRAAVLGFHSDGRTVADTHPDTLRFDKVGGISKFFNRLQQRIEATRCDDPAKKSDVCADWTINLIGHSMGAIVANHVVHNHADIEFANIVYMAAACSVREYEDNVLPYLEKHPSTEMYHLTLDPFAEVREEHAGELPPSGSLLVWIDNFFTTPATLRDRTAGRFENLIRFIDETRDTNGMRSRIHFKAFGLGTCFRELHQPQEHGDFFNTTFWESRFWKTTAQLAREESEHAPVHASQSMQ